MKKTRKPLLILSIILVFGLFAVIRLPAALIWSRLPAGIEVSGSEGTIWSGRATALGLKGQLLQQNLQWQFQLSSLFRGRIEWNLRGQYRNDASKVRLAATFKGFEVRDLELALPLEPLLAQDEKMKAMRFGGLLRVTAPPIRNKAPFTLNAKLENFFSVLTIAAGPLGSYQATLNMRPDGTGDWQVSHIEGVLTISGGGQIDSKGMNGRLNLKPDANAASYLQTMLAMLPRGDDGYTITLPM